MFTGLVQSLAEVVSIVAEGPGVRLTVREPAMSAVSYDWRQHLCERLLFDGGGHHGRLRGISSGQRNALTDEPRQAHAGRPGEPRAVAQSG